ncbi:cell adhesion molecule 4-like [Diadema setosum]|uniref:cell adhesion molecule 4-like n=1 Tax=Diadema setosum TaxID=31175 RepID=UPI003B3A06D5
MATISFRLLAISLVLLTTRTSLSHAQYFSIQPEDKEVVEGNRVVMPCRVLNRPDGAEVYWQIPAITTQFVGPDYNVPQGFRDRYQVVGDVSLGDYNLVINSASGADEGVYKCVMYLTGRGDATAVEVASSQEAELIVATLDPSGAPECWVSPRREVHVDDEVQLHCASSDANVDLQWRRVSSNNLLPSTSNASTSVPTLISTSVIADASMNGDRFECLSTTVNSVRCQVELTVTSPPVVTITTVGDIRTGREGRFRCDATGNPNVFAFFWRYGDKEIDYAYDRRFNLARLEDNNQVLVLPDIQTDDDGILLTCTAINEHGEGSGTYPIRVVIENITALVAPILCSIIIAIIIVLLIGFCYWRSRQRRALEKIAQKRDERALRRIDSENQGHDNPTFTGFSPLEIDSVGYGPDAQPYTTNPSAREYDHGQPKPIPRQNSDVRSKGESESGVGDDEEEETQTFTYQVNPNFEEYRNKASYDVSNELDDEKLEKGKFLNYEEVDVDLEKPPVQNDLDLEKELVGELSMFADYDKNFDQDSEPVVVSTEL